MLMSLGRKYRGNWAPKTSPVSVRFNDNMWKVISASDEENEFFFGLFHKADGSAFYITAEDLEGETISPEVFEQVIFAKMFNADNDASMNFQFLDSVDGKPFVFFRFSFMNRKFGPQFANYGYATFGDILLIIGLSWPADLETSASTNWPIKHEILMSGTSIGYGP